MLYGCTAADRLRLYFPPHLRIRSHHICSEQCSWRGCVCHSRSTEDRCEGVTLRWMPLANTAVFCAVAASRNARPHRAHCGAHLPRSRSNCLDDCILDGHERGSARTRSSGRCKFVVMAIETGGWSEEAVNVLRQLAHAKARESITFFLCASQSPSCGSAFGHECWQSLVPLHSLPAAHLTWCHTGGEAPVFADLLDTT